MHRSDCGLMADRKLQMGWTKHYPGCNLVAAMEQPEKILSDQMRQLLQALDALENESSKLSLLIKMVEGLSLPFEQSINQKSSLVNTSFAEYFLNRLLIHHAIADEKLNKLAFEYIFLGALVASGHNAQLTKGKTVPGADLVIVPPSNNESIGIEKLSLKTEGADNAQPRAIKISKLMEARWMRDRDAAGLVEGIQERILPHLNQYDRIFTLRSFEVNLKGKKAVRYDLVEIPSDLLRRVSSIKAEDISFDNKEVEISGESKPKKKRQTFSVSVNDENSRPAFKLIFDGSVEKISISNLIVSEEGPAIIHASWTITIPDIIRYHGKK